MQYALVKAKYIGKDDFFARNKRSTLVLATSYRSIWGSNVDFVVTDQETQKSRTYSDIFKFLNEWQYVRQIKKARVKISNS